VRALRFWSWPLRYVRDEHFELGCVTHAEGFADPDACDVDVTAFHIWPAVIDRHDFAHARFRIGKYDDATQRERFVCRSFTVFAERLAARGFTPMVDLFAIFNTCSSEVLVL
jgi:hypothetical protein